MAKHGGAKTPEHLGKFKAGGLRARHRRRLRAAEVSSGRNLGGGLNQDNDPRRAHIDTTPAVWRRVSDWIGDYEYVDGDLDVVMLRALHDRVVYAQSACCHHEPPFCDITVATIAAVDKQFRKSGKRASRGLLKGQPTKPKKKSAYREGRPLSEVVADLFKKE